jgi:dihydrofolate reductase
MLRLSPAVTVAVPLIASPGRGRIPNERSSVQGSVYVAISLDGFIARRDGNLDWLMGADAGEGDFGFDEFLSSVDALAMGRNTFDFVLGAGEWPYGQKPVFVMTHRALDLPAGFPGRVEAFAGSPEAFATECDHRGIEKVYVDGGETVQAFIRAGLVTRIVTTRLPKLIGSGIPLFGPINGDVNLRLVESRAFENGWIRDEYEVVS